MHPPQSLSSANPYVAIRVAIRARDSNAHFGIRHQPIAAIPNLHQWIRAASRPDRAVVSSGNGGHVDSRPHDRRELRGVELIDAALGSDPDVALSVLEHVCRLIAAHAGGTREG